MGFLSEFAGTVVVDADTGKVCEGPRPTWWVEMLRNLPHADHVEADRILYDSMSVDSNEDGEDGRVRMGGSGLMAQQEEVLARSIVGWNLTDENDEPLPVGDLTGVHDPAKRAAAVAVTRASLARLPERLVLDLKLAAVKRNQPRKGQEAATFPDEPAELGDDSGGGTVDEPGTDAVGVGEVHA